MGEVKTYFGHVAFGIEGTVSVELNVHFPDKAGELPCDRTISCTLVWKLYKLESR